MLLSVFAAVASSSIAMLQLVVLDACQPPNAEVVNSKHMVPVGLG